MSATSPPLPVPRKPHPRPASSSQVIGRYTDCHGRARELACLLGMHGSTLVIDRLAATLTDARLIAHLSGDEPAENALLISKLYLADRRGRCCRTLTAEDLKSAPLAGAPDTVACHEGALATDQAQPVDEQGRVYRLQPTPAEMSIPELRWQRQTPTSPEHPYETVSVREAIGSLQNYEPIRSSTSRALAAHECDSNLSVAVLRAELVRVNASPIVLNRALREAVLTAVARNGVSMSEIAIRCGRVKYGRRGNISGETSWLGRRIGQLPEGGQSTPTPWIHSDTLALIARQGLRIAPRDVEVG